MTQSEDSPEVTTPDGRLWPLYLLFATSGFAALIYQVMWARSFGLVFGSTSQAASVVLAAFFFGMGLGNFVGGRWVRERGRAQALLGYAWLEIGIALLALLVLFWLALYQAVYPSLYQSRLATSGGLLWIRIGLAFLALVPACTAMGATLPLISRSVVSRPDHLNRRLASIYALNTLGAVAGALLSGFLLPVWIGIQNSVFAAALINAGVGAATFLLWRSWPRRSSADTVEPPTPRPAPTTPRSDRFILLVAAVSGFGTLALEVFYTRLLINVMDTSVHSFAVVLATFLALLALGSFFVSAVGDRIRSSWTLVASAAGLGSTAILFSPRLCGGAAKLCNMQLSPGSEWEYYRWLFNIALVILGPGVFLIGMILPAIWKIATRISSETGEQVGFLTGINTFGAVTGSLSAGFIIIPWLGTAQGIVGVAGLYAALAISIALVKFRGVGRWVVSAILVVSLMPLASLPPWMIRMTRVGKNERVIWYQEGEGGTVAIRERRSSKGRTLTMTLNNDYTLGRSSDVAVHRGQGRLGLLLHSEPRDIAFIGLATGMTVSAIKEFPSIERAIAMELVPGVLEAAHEFKRANLEVLEDPRLEVVVADGRNHLYGTDETFDVIIGDLFIPWMAGAGYLYTEEHFQIVKARLRAQGIFVQWLQVNQVSQEELRIILATFLGVFDGAELWLNNLQAGRPLLGMVGRPASGKEISGGIAAVEGMERLCDSETLAAWVRGAPINTDNFPIIEFSTASSHLTRQQGAAQQLLKDLSNLCRDDSN